MRNTLVTSILSLLFLFGLSTNLKAGNELIPSGAYIVNMSVQPQTIDNALQPYGMIFELLSEYHVPVKWVINPAKGKDGVDFSYDGTDYKAAPFIILEEYRSTEVDSVIAAWEALGVVGVTTTTDIIVPVYLTIDYYMVWTLDAQNGGIAEGYLENAGIPQSAYNWVLPGNLTCCDDIFVMPHADPEWLDGGVLGHGRLYDWTDDITNLDGCNGSIWAACHAVSALELMFNPAAPAEQTNFLSNKTGTATGSGPYSDPNNSLVEWGDHGETGVPPAYVYDYPTHPVMQFLGNMDDALQNGSEQSYLPVLGGGWRPQTQIAVEIPAHDDVPELSLGEAVKVAFGDAFGDPNRGKIMYEAGHSHDGGSEANVAAQRAFLNFSFWAVQFKAISASMSSVPETLEGGSDILNLTATATGGTGVYTYTWTSDCPGSFSNPSGQTTTFTPDFVTEAVGCGIQLIVEDDCGTRSGFDNQSTITVPAPVPPVANDDAGFVNPTQSITLNALDNDTDLNLDIDPSTFTFVTCPDGADLGTPVSTTHGNFVDNGNGSVTYNNTNASTPPATVESVCYKICDETPVIDGGPFCDYGEIFITIDETDEFGCTPTQSYERDYEAYGFSYTENAFVTSGFFALGYPEGLARNKPATLAKGASDAVRGQITITISEAALPGDTIKLYGWAKDGDGTTFSVTTSADGSTFGDIENYSAPDKTQSYTFDYIVPATHPNGINFIRVQCTAVNDEFFLDGISYAVKECKDACVLPQVDLIFSGTATDWDDVNSTASNETKATGLPNLDGAQIDATEILIMDLGQVVPEGTSIQVFLGHNGGSPTVEVSSSLTSPGFADTETFEPDVDKDEAYQQFIYTVPAGSGIQFLEIVAVGAQVFADAIVFEVKTCEDGVPVAVNDVTYTIENFPVTYPVQVNDSDPQGDALTTTQITNDPDFGTAVINPDGTITYTPNDDYVGTDVLTYQICDASGLCDEATLTITIPNDGCTNAELAKIVGTGYGFTATGTGSPENAVGVPDGATATVNGGQDPDDELVITLNNTVYAGDSLIFYVSAEDGNQVDYTLSLSNDAGFTSPVNQSYSITGTTITRYAIQATINAGTNYVKFTNTGASKDLKVDAVEHYIRECLPDNCTLPDVPREASGYATGSSEGGVTFIAGAATGAPDQTGEKIEEKNSDKLYIDLGEIVPEDAFVYLYLARGGITADVDVKSSVDNVVAYADVQTFEPTVIQSDYQQFRYTINTVGGIRYLELEAFEIASGDAEIYVDAVQFYINDCEDGTPIAVDDVTFTSEETPITYPVLVNDSDPQNDPLTVTITSDPTNGSAVVNPDGTITYTPDDDYNGTDVLTYEICDPTGLCDQATLTITIPSDGCGTDNTAVIVGTGYGFEVADPVNDIGNEWDAIGIVNGTYAELNKNVSANLEITLSETVAAGDSIHYYISGSDGDACTFTIEIFDGTSWEDLESSSVSGTIITKFSYVVSDADGAQKIRFISTDVDDKLRVDAVEYNLKECLPIGCIKAETAFIQTGNGVTGTLNAAAETDIEGAPNGLNAQIDFNDPGTDIAIIDFDQVVPEGSIVYFYVSQDGTDAVTGNIASSLTNGSYTNDATFTPSSNDNASFQQFSYTVPSGGLQFLEFTATAGSLYFLDAAQFSTFESNSLGGYVWGDTDKGGTINGVEAGYAGVDVDIYEDVDISGDVSAGDVLIQNLTTDADGYYAYQFFASSLPLNYVIEVDETTLPTGDNFYTTAQYQSGTLTLATDSDCDNNFGRAFDNPPVAVDDAVSTEANTPLVIAVLTEGVDDSEPDGEDLTVTEISSAPSNGGTASINPDGTVNYTPPVGFVGTETFDYVICDEADPAAICDTATVTVTVDPYVNDPPVAVNDGVTIEKDETISVDVLDNDSDPENDFLTVTCVGTDADEATPNTCDGLTDEGGTVSILPNGEVFYTPPLGFIGTDVTTYVICDPGGLCDEATITFTVEADVNDPPIAGDDLSIVAVPCGMTTFSVVDNDYDPDGSLDLTTLALSGPPPPSGTLVANLDGTFTYTPNVAGNYTFDYTICDNGVPTPQLCDIGTVTLSVPASNTAPVGVDDADNINTNTTLTTPVLSNDTDAELNNLSVKVCDPASPMTGCALTQLTTAGGTVNVLPSGKVEYIPPAGYAGTDTYFYEVCDDDCNPLCDYATVTVTISNLPPVAVDDADATSINTLINIKVQDNDFDPEGQALSIPAGTGSVGTDPANPNGGATTQGGTVTVLGDGTVDYTPPTGFIGQDTFYYEICDANAYVVECDIAEVIVTVTSPIDVEIVKTVLPENPDAGENVTYMLTLTNTSASTATGVKVLDKLPGGLSHVSNNGGGSYDPVTGIWYIGDVAPGGSASLQIIATVNDFKDAENTAEVIDHNEVDTDSTPDNGIEAEDDQSTVILECVLKIEPISVIKN